MRSFTLVAAMYALLQPLGVAKASRGYVGLTEQDSPLASDADTVEQEAIKLGFSWPMMDLTSVNTNGFLSSIDEHDLSIVAFHTKAAPVWPLVRAVLKTAKANFTARHPDYKIQWAEVDLDENPRLSTFTHLNVIDVMFFYPDMANFPIRSRGNISVSGMLNETEYMWQYSVPGMKHWDDMTQVLSDFVLASLQGAGDPQTAVDALEVYHRRTKLYVDAIEAVAKDTGYLASKTNKLKHKMRQWQSRYHDPDEFLRAKEEAFVMDEFLQYAFHKDEFAEKKEKKTQKSREENRKPLVPNKPAPPVAEGELM